MLGPAKQPAPEANTAILTALRGAEGPEWRATLVAALKSRAAPESVDVLVGASATGTKGCRRNCRRPGRDCLRRRSKRFGQPFLKPRRYWHGSIGDACIRAVERLVARGR